MTTEEKRRAMAKTVAPTVRALEPDRAEWYLRLLREADPAYIELAFEQFFAQAWRQHERETKAGTDAEQVW